MEVPKEVLTNAYKAAELAQRYCMDEYKRIKRFCDNNNKCFDCWIDDSSDLLRNVDVANKAREDLCKLIYG